MGNVIQDELELAKSMMIEEVDFKGKKLAKLTRENVAKVEAMIRNDSAYLSSMDVNAKPELGKANGYKGSSAYWMTQLKRILSEGDLSVSHSYKEIIEAAVAAVDRENSTHLNSDHCGRTEIVDRICNFDRIELVECLRNPEHDDMKLIREISRITSAPQKARKNLSFASKFCHYACFYLFEGTEYQDNYSIYDSILKKVIPWYLSYYQIEQKFDINDYRDYRMAVDCIRKASGIEISRNGFDHLLWYYHKSRI